MVCNFIQILTQIGSDVPKMSELHDHVMDAGALYWFELGIELGLQVEKLNVIKCDHPTNLKKCCTAMFKHWLDVDKTVSWDKLIIALRNIEHIALAEKIKAMTSKGTFIVVHNYMYVVTCVWTCT